MDQTKLKKLAAERAVDEVHSGMILGLGTGSTFNFVLEKLAEKIKTNKLNNIIGIPSSQETKKRAEQFGITLSNLVEHPVIDLTIDGADEVAVGNPECRQSRDEGSHNINLIKGGGGALLHEKILAQASKKYVIVIDESKLSKSLGEKFSVPIEVIKMAVNVEKKYLESIGAIVSIRKNLDGTNFITDENNFILDANFGVIKNLNTLIELLDKRAGIVEHGLFINLTGKLICAMKNKEIITKP